MFFSDNAAVVDVINNQTSKHQGIDTLKVHLTPKIVFRLIKCTCYSKHFGGKIFEFA